MVLPSDFALPALPYLAALALGGVVAVVLLYRRRPPVTERTVAALAPWMAAGGTLYALYQAGAAPEPLAPLFSAPAVYVSVGVLAGLVWAGVADRDGSTWSLTGAAGPLAASGSVLLAAALVAAALAETPDTMGTSAAGSAVILAASIAATAVAWVLLSRTAEVSATGAVGVLAVFGHTLDGISTAVGYDLLGFGEQTPLSRIILEAGAALPPDIGGGWLFALVKIALGGAIVVLFESYVREAPAEGYLVLGLVAAVGFGPGFHNLVLFALL